MSLRIFISKIGFYSGKLGLLEISRFNVFKKTCNAFELGKLNNIGLKIRLMRPEDIPTISRELNINFKAEVSRGSGGMVALIDGKLVNWSLFAVNKVYRGEYVKRFNLNHHSAYIHAVYTMREYRGNGIAPQVIDAICGYLFQKNIRHVYLCINPANQASLRFASKAGFKNIGHITYIQILKLLVCMAKTRNMNESMVLKNLFKAG